MRKYLRWAVVGMELLLVASLIQGIGQARQARQRVLEMRRQKQELMEERAELLGRLEYVQSPEYLDKVAREELNLAKPGETVVIVPEGTITEEREMTKDESEEKLNYLKWWEVLWGE